MKTQPTQRSLKYLRDRGAIACKVEQRLVIPGAPFPRLRDAFNIGDILGAQRHMRTFLVQTTTRSNMNQRVTKILGILAGADPKQPRVREWLDAGGRIFVHGWSKRGPRGKRKHWNVRVVEIIAEGVTFKVLDLDSEIEVFREASR